MVTLLYPDAATSTPALAAVAEADAHWSGLRDRTVGAPLIDITPAGPVVATSAGAQQLKLGDLRGYQVRRVGLGAVEGLGVGALLGGALGAAVGYSGGDDPPCMSNLITGCLFYVQQTAREKAVIGGVLLGVSGAIIGGAIGAVVGHTDKYVF